jgi:hypothetical protein
MAASWAAVQTYLIEPQGSKEIAAMGVSCPKCRETSVRRSRRRLFLDFILGSIGMVPYRCNACEHRFFRFRRNTATAAGG